VCTGAATNHIFCKEIHEVSVFVQKKKVQIDRDVDKRYEEKHTNSSFVLKISVDLNLYY
jgi:hypothetical protein